jgi:hypothetical protein
LPTSRSWTKTRWLSNPRWSLAAGLLSSKQALWISCHYCNPRCTLESFLLLAAWSLIPNSTWRTDISNVLHCAVPILLFPSPSLVGVGTCWSHLGCDRSMWLRFSFFK